MSLKEGESKVKSNGSKGICSGISENREEEKKKDTEEERIKRTFHGLADSSD